MAFCTCDAIEGTRAGRNTVTTASRWRLQSYKMVQSRFTTVCKRSGPDAGRGSTSSSAAYPAARSIPRTAVDRASHAVSFSEVTTCSRITCHPDGNLRSSWKFRPYERRTRTRRASTALLGIIDLRSAGSTGKFAPSVQRLACDREYSTLARLSA